MFAQVNANQPRLLEWLVAERTEAVKFMTAARDVVMLHRRQGDVERLDKMIDLLANAGRYLKP